MLLKGHLANPSTVHVVYEWPLSVNDCDCDVVFYCKLICEDEGKESSYDSETETCCCLDNPDRK